MYNKCTIFINTTAIIIRRCSYEDDYISRVQCIEVFTTGLNSEFFTCIYNVLLIKWLKLYK